MVNTSNRRWIVPGSVAAVAIAASLGVGTLGAYTASITNDNNTAGAGNLVMQETGPDADGNDIVCTSTDGDNNSAVCSGINKYGGNMAMSPGQAVSTTVELANVGTIPATAFTLAAGACTNEPADSDVCSLMNIQIQDGTTQVYNGTAAGLANESFTLSVPVEPDASREFTITATLPEEAGNSAQGGTISQPLTWTFTA